MAYFLVGVLVPAAALGTQGELKGFNSEECSRRPSAELWARSEPFASSGRLSMGAARCLSCRSYSACPLINVLFTMAMHPPKTSPNPLLYLGYLRHQQVSGWCLATNRLNLFEGVSIRTLR